MLKKIEDFITAKYSMLYLKHGGGLGTVPKAKEDYSQARLAFRKRYEGFKQF